MNINVSHTSTGAIQDGKKSVSPKPIDSTAINNLFKLELQLMRGEITKREASYQLLNLTSVIGKYLPMDLKAKLGELWQDFISGGSAKSSISSAKDLGHFAQAVAKMVPSQILILQGARDLESHFSDCIATRPVTSDEKQQIRDFLNEISPIYQDLDQKAKNAYNTLKNYSNPPTWLLEASFKQLADHIENPNSANQYSKVAGNHQIATHLAKYKV